MRVLTTLLLALCLQTANAQESFDATGVNTPDQVGLDAWNYYCLNTLNGNPAMCTCVLELQNQQNDPNVVKGSLLQLVADNEDASDSDNTVAQDALVEMYSGDLTGPRSDMTEFKSTLNNNVKTCTLKPKL